MSLLARIFVVLFAFLLACVVAAAVVAFVLVLATTPPGDPYPDQHGIALAYGMFVMFVSLSIILVYVTLPAMLVIALAEALRLRSFLFYAFAGVVLAFGPAYNWNISFLRNTGDDFGTRGAEIVAAIGIAAGFVYWALAGRNAGDWRKPAVTAAPARSIRAPE